ncbi:MAG: hypothetical protein ACFB0C_22765 [Leptolyngbyaceae cyanobacterium]
MASRTVFSPARWLPWVMAVGVFWLSSSLLLDLVIMPVMYTSGMMAEPSFAPAGYSLFWTFNRLELVCAAIILTGVLALRKTPGEFDVLTSGSRSRWALGIGMALLGVTLICTYGLTPEMGALGVSLDTFAETYAAPAAMDWLHGAYWCLEALKLLGLGLLTGLCYRDVNKGNDIEAIS